MEFRVALTVCPELIQCGIQGIPRGVCMAFWTVWTEFRLVFVVDGIPRGILILNYEVESGLFCDI